MPTAVPISSGRQQLIVANLDLVLANFATTVDYNLIQVPAGAVIEGGAIVVDTVFNSTTSDVISIGDTTTYNLYKSALTIQATGLTALVPTGKIYTVPTWLTARWVSGGGTPTTGALRVSVTYYVRGRAQFTQGPDYGLRLA